MSRPYVWFKEKRLWKKIDYDKAYGYQCTDLIKQYLDECLGWWIVSALWNANQIPWNLQKQWFWAIEPSKSIIQWDIIVRTKWRYWHIAIVDRVLGNKVHVLEQNWSWKDSWSGEWQNAIRIQPYDIDRFQVVLRNDDIVSNWNKERKYIEEKIWEYVDKLNITQDYLKSIKYPVL